MQKQAPTLGRLLVMSGFALSCFGLILFLWVAFGGPVPFAAKGYQVKVDFANAGQLAQQADVRISGVPVGTVAKVQLGHGNTTQATLQIDPRYAPIPRDTRAILRTKTLLGETYVELTPGNRANGVMLADGGTLPERQVKPQVTLDRIFQTFDGPTRKAFQEWQQGAAGALAGRGGDLNDAFGNLPSFTESADNTLSVLNSESAAVTQLVRDTGTVFSALSERGNQFRDFITSWNKVFTTTAKRNQELAQVFQILPTFEKESTLTLNQLKTVAQTGNPLVLQLQPAAEQLSPILESAAQLAPSLQTVATKLGPLVDASAAGVPALDMFLNGDASHKSLADLLGQLNLLLQQVNPMLSYLNVYKTTVPPFFANATAATQGTYGGDGQHYLRASTGLNLYSLAALPNRPVTDRTSPYVLPDQGQYAFPTVTGPSMTGYETRQCDHPLSPFMPSAPTDAPNTQPFNDSNSDVAGWLKAIVYAGGHTDPLYPAIPALPKAPGCTQQGNVTGFSTLFPLINQETP